MLHRVQQKSGEEHQDSILRRRISKRLHRPRQVLQTLPRSYCMLYRLDSSRRSPPRRTISKKATAPSSRTPRSLRVCLVGMLFAALVMCYYSLVNRVLKDSESLQVVGESVARLGQEERARASHHESNNTATHPSFLQIYGSPTDNDSTRITTRSRRKPKATIAYLTSVTACPADHKKFVDVAAVLRHSIHLASIRNPNSPSAYDYQMYAIIHPEAADCAAGFEHIGYNVLLRDTPVQLSEIQSQPYVQRLTNPNAGCCAEKEFLKLYAYTMHDYPLAVHLDMDFILLQPMDEILDVFFLPDDATKEIAHAMWPAQRQWNDRIESMFTRDYPMAHPGREPVKVGMQGGFWIVRPNQTAFDEMVAIIKQGNFQGGWFDGKVHYPGFYGAPMIQGLVGFYYGHYHPGQIVELDRCIHNQMVDDPTNNSGECFVPVDGQCRDCRKQNLTDVYSAHFTFCGKPWLCVDKKHFKKSSEKTRLCLDLHKEWHRTRYDLEMRLGIAKQVALDDMYYGHCTKRHYTIMDLESL